MRARGPGRPLCSEEGALNRGFWGAECARRREVLRETIAAFEQADPADRFHRHGIRHAVLGAFGCGAFRNPADRVAHLYREEIGARAADFSVIAFAVFRSGYGPDNYPPFFAETFRDAPAGAVPAASSAGT